MTKNSIGFSNEESDKDIPYREFMNTPVTANATNESAVGVYKGVVRESGVDYVVLTPCIVYDGLNVPHVVGHLPIKIAFPLMSIRPFIEGITLEKLVEQIKEKISSDKSRQSPKS